MIITKRSLVSKISIKNVLKSLRHKLASKLKIPNHRKNRSNKILCLILHHQEFKETVKTKILKVTLHLNYLAMLLQTLSKMF